MGNEEGTTLTRRHRRVSSSSPPFVLISHRICMCFACDLRLPVNRATCRAAGQETIESLRQGTAPGDDLLLRWQETNENFQTIWLICRDLPPHKSIPPRSSRAVKPKNAAANDLCRPPPYRECSFSRRTILRHIEGYFQDREIDGDISVNREYLERNVALTCVGLSDGTSDFYSVLTSPRKSARDYL